MGVNFSGLLRPMAFSLAFAGTGGCPLEHPTASPDGSSDILNPDTLIRPPADTPTVQKDAFIPTQDVMPPPSDTSKDGGADISGEVAIDAGEDAAPDVMMGGEVFVDIPEDVFADAGMSPDGTVVMDAVDVPAVRDADRDALSDSGERPDSGPVFARPGGVQFFLLLDEASGTDVSSAATTPATLFGRLSGGSRTPAGFIRGAVLLTMSGERITASNASAGDFGTGNMGIAAWVRLLSATTTRTIFAKRGAYAFRINSAGNLLFTSSDAACVITSTTGITDDRWHHVAAVRNGGQALIFLDGLQVSAAMACGSNLTSINLFHIGCSESGSSCNLPLGGSVDQVYAWTSGTDEAGVRSLVCADQLAAGVSLASFCR